MKYFVFSILFFLNTLISFAGVDIESVSHGNTYALVAGISDYQELMDLQYARSDAERMAAYLSDSLGGKVPKENIFLLTDSGATRQNFLKSFNLILDKIQYGDRFIFYFAGLAYNDPLNGESMFLFDSKKDDFGSVLQWNLMSKLIESFKSKGCDIIFYWDSSNLGNSSMEKMNSTFNDRNSSLSIFYASQPNQLALEGRQFNGGLFTTVLIKGLYAESDDDKDGIISSKELSRYLEDEVSRISENRQVPMFYGDLFQEISVANAKYTIQESTQKSYGESSLNDVEAISEMGSKPNFTITKPEVCFGQAILTVNDSTEVEIKINNNIDYFLINSIKTKVDKKKSIRVKIPINTGLNKISIKAFNGLEVTEDSLNVYSTYVKNGIEKLIDSKRKVNHYALFIAIDDYDELDHLNNPIYDAREIALNLQKNYGFEIDTLMNPTKEQIQFKLREYAERLSPEDRKNRDDHLLIYFSGHGAKDVAFNNGYFAPKEAKKKDDFFNSYISFDDLRTKINALNYKHILVMMDACYSGLLDSDLASASKASPSPELPRNLKVFVEEKLNHETRRMITAGGAVEVSDGKKGKHSPFASILLESFRAGNIETLPMITIEYLLGKLESNETVVHHAAFLANDPGSNFLFFYQGEK